MHQNIEKNVKTSIDALTEKSVIVDVSGKKSEQNFSEFIKKAYCDLQLSFDGRTELFMEIIAQDVTTKIVFVRGEAENLKYELDDETKCSYIKLNDITYMKCETIIIIAAKGYDEESNYRKFLGYIAHTFCDFTLHEIFEILKSYNENDSRNSKKLKKLLVGYQDSTHLSKFPIIKETFDKYPEYEWVDELFVRYVQFHVEHDNEVEKLQEFHETFVELSKMFNYLEKQFNSEYIKISALRIVNERTFLGDKKSKIYANPLKTIFEIDLEPHRQVIRTNQTYLMMKNIFKNIEKIHKFESQFMLIDVGFLEPDHHFDLIEAALQGQKVASLIVDCHSDAYFNPSIREKLWHLFNCSYNGRVVLIMHESQDFRFKTKVKSIKFSAKDLTKEFKGSLKVYFQGSKLMLKDLIDVDLINGAITTLFNNKVYETFSSKEISIGNQQSFKTDKIPRYYVNRKYRQKTFNGWSDEINLDDEYCLREVFEKNRCIFIMNESREGKTVESYKMYQRVKAAYPKLWIVHVNLADHIKGFAYTFDSCKSYLDFFTREIMKIKTIEKEIFDKFFNAGHVVFIFDGLDEICESLMEKVEKIVTHFVRINKLCIFARPFAMEKFKIEKKNLIQFKITELNDAKKRELARKFLESKENLKTENFDAFLQKLYICLDLTEVDDYDSKSDAIYDSVDNFTVANPFAIEMATEIFSSHPDTFNTLVKSTYNLYHEYFKSSSNFATNEKIEALCKIAFENIISSNALNKYQLKTSAEHDKEKRQDLKMFTDEFFPCHTNVVIVNSLNNSGFLINDNDSTYRFENTLFEAHFIAHFIRENCEKLFKNKKFLNILCYIAMKLEQTDRLEFFIEQLKKCFQVESYLSTLDVFKQIFNRNAINHKDSINIDPILIELCRGEPTFKERFLTRFSDPFLKAKDFEKLKLSVFAECGEYSSTGYYVSIQDFERIFKKCKFMRNKQSLVSKFIGSTEINESFYIELISSLENVPAFKHHRVIKLFLELHEHYLANENYLKRSFLNDNLIELLLNKNVDSEITNMITSVFIKFCYHSKITIREMFNSDKIYFSKCPLELLLDCESVYDEYLTNSSLVFLMNLVESEENFVECLFPNELVKCFSRALINFPNEVYSMKVKVILGYIQKHFNIENSKKAFLFRRHNVSIQPIFDLYLEKKGFYDIQMCADEYKFNIIQLALLDNFKSPTECFFEELSKEFMKAISIDANYAMILRENIFTDEFLRILCKLICGDFFVKSKTLKIVKHLNDAQYIGRFLSFMVKFEKIENLESFLNIIQAVIGDEIFVELMLSYEQPLRSLIVQSSSFEQVDVIIFVMIKCDSFCRNLRNVPKLIGLLNVNNKLSDEDIKMLIKKYELVVSSYT